MMTSLSPSRTVVTSFTPRRRSSPPHQQKQQQQQQQDSNNYLGLATTGTGNSLSSPDSTDATANSYYEDGDWVLCVTATAADSASCTSNGTPDWIGCALSNGQIHVYDTGRLHLMHCYENVHNTSDKQHVVTDITTNTACPNVLVTSGTDGRVCLFDLRQQQHHSNSAVSLALPRAPHEQALSVALGYQGQLVAVGSSKAQVHFFDVRKAAVGPHQPQPLLGSYVDAHTEEVTRLRFQPATNSSSTLLATGSEDGLVCTFDTSQPSEELALKSVLNVQSPIRQIRFFGPNSEGLCCLTGSETMSVWHHDAAQRIQDYHGLDLRQHLSLAVDAAVARAGSDRPLSSMPLEYLVDCHWSAEQQQLYLLAGNQLGDAALIQVQPTGTFHVTNTLQGGHKGVIRGWCPLSQGVGGMNFVTVGEDARLCEWNNAGESRHQHHHARVSTAAGLGGDVAMNEDYTSSAAVSMSAIPGATSSQHTFMIPPASSTTPKSLTINAGHHGWHNGASPTTQPQCVQGTGVGKHRRKRHRSMEETWNSSPY